MVKLEAISTAVATAVRPVASSASSGGHTSVDGAQREVRREQPGEEHQLRRQPHDHAHAEDGGAAHGRGGDGHRPHSYLTAPDRRRSPKMGSMVPRADACGRCCSSGTSIRRWRSSSSPLAGAVPRGGPPAGPTHAAPPVAGRPHGVVRAGPARDRCRDAVRPGPLRRGAVLAPHRPAHPARDGGARAAGAVGARHPRPAGEPPAAPNGPSPGCSTTRSCARSPTRWWRGSLFGGTLFALYFSPLFELSLRNPWVHQAVHLHFLAVGLPLRVGRGRHRRAAPAAPAPGPAAVRPAGGPVPRLPRPGRAVGGRAPARRRRLRRGRPRLGVEPRRRPAGRGRAAVGGRRPVRAWWPAASCWCSGSRPTSADRHVKIGCWTRTRM